MGISKQEIGILQYSLNIPPAFVIQLFMVLIFVVLTIYEYQNIKKSSKWWFWCCPIVIFIFWYETLTPLDSEENLCICCRQYKKYLEHQLVDLKIYTNLIMTLSNLFVTLTLAPNPRPRSWMQTSDPGITCFPIFSST